MRDLFTISLKENNVFIRLFETIIDGDRLDLCTDFQGQSMNGFCKLTFKSVCYLNGFKVRL